MPFKITAPNAEYTGYVGGRPGPGRYQIGTSGPAPLPEPLRFIAGVAYADELAPSHRQYCESAGYTITEVTEVPAGYLRWADQLDRGNGELPPPRPSDVDVDAGTATA